MALYTQFQDPAQYYLRKEERRDEGLRNAMAMMMQMKMQQREWARQNKLDELSERRVSAYEQSVADQDKETQKQWQVREQAFRERFGYGSPEYWRAMSGESIADIESSFYPESTINTLTDWAKMTRSEWDALSPRVKTQYYNKYFTEQNADTMAGYRDQRAQESRDIKLADVALEGLGSMERLINTKFKDYIDTGAGNPKVEALVELEKARDEIREFQRDVLRGAATVDDARRKKIDLFVDPRVQKDVWWFIPKEKREAYKKSMGITGRNNVAPNGPEQIASNPAIDVKREVIAGGYVDKPASAVKAIVASMGKDPASVTVDDKTMPGFGLVALGGKTYRFPLQKP